MATCSTVDATTIVFFEAGQCTLTDGEVNALGSWVLQWIVPNRRCQLQLGGAGETSRTNRLRRLSNLLSVLQNLGVNRKQIQIDDEWLKPNRMGTIDDLPADTFWLHATE
jgi:hypothetical protein